MSHTIFRVVRHGKEHDTVTDQPLPHGTVGTLKTLRALASMVIADSHNEEVDRIVKGTILRGARPHDDTDEIAHCFQFARDQIAWRRDAEGVERIADFLSTYNLPGQRWGDCGDKSEVLATSLACLGHTPYFVYISQSWPGLFGDFHFNHVYVGVRHKGRHFGLDPTPQDKVEGWEARATRRMGFRIFPEKGKPETWVIE